MHYNGVTDIGTVTCVGRLVDVLDKKSGALVIVDGE